MFRPFQSNHYQFVYQKHKQEFVWFFFLTLLVYGMMVVILGHPLHVAAVYNFCIKTVDCQIIFFYYRKYTVVIRY